MTNDKFPMTNQGQNLNIYFLTFRFELSLVICNLSFELDSCIGKK